MSGFVLALLWCGSLLLNPVAAAAGLGPCDPIDGYKCYLPWPNNFWLRNNSLAVTKETFPQGTTAGFDPVKGGWDQLDGFSPVSVALSYFANMSLELSDVPRLWNISRSLDADSPSILLDTVTGKVLPHFVELDHRSDLDMKGPYARTTMLWPTRALENGRRYIVAYRNLKSASGPITPSTAFKALRDKLPSSDPNVNLRRAHFEEIFQMLEKVGVDRSSLVLAWDYSVGSRDSITGRMVHMRDDAFSRIPSGGPNYSITSVTNNYTAQIARKVTGVMQVPLYMTGPGPNTTLVLGPDGLPQFQGYANATFTVMIPQSLVKNKTLGTAMQYGHGLFGSQREVEDGYLQQIADRDGIVMIAVDWWGLSEEDAIYVAVMLVKDLSRFAIVPDRCSQGMLNALLSMRLLTGRLTSDPSMLFDGVAVLGPLSPRRYYGNSQGGILGTVYMAVSTEVDRGCIGVGGGPYSLLLPRSVDFSTFWQDMQSVYHDPVDLIFLLSALQVLWDRLEPSGYMNSITANPLPRTPAKQILMQYAVGDAQVTYLGAYTIARSIGASMFQSNVVEANQTTFGFKFIPDTASSSGPVIVGWEFPNVPPVPDENVPPNKATDTHEGPRQQLDAQQMMTQFFSTGKIVNTCQGTCHGKMPGSGQVTHNRPLPRVN